MPSLRRGLPLLHLVVPVCALVAVAAAFTWARVDWSHRTDDALSQAAVANVENDVMLGHLWLEESLAGDHSRDVGEVRRLFLRADQNCARVGASAPPYLLDDKPTAGGVRALCDEVSALRVASDQRIDHRIALGTPAEQRYDRRFIHVVARANEVSAELRVRIRNARARENTLDLALGGMLVIVLVVGGGALVLRNRKLRLAGRQRALILGSAGDGIVGCDASGRIVFANPTASAITGHSEARLTGMHVREVLAGVELPRGPLALEGGVEGSALAAFDSVVRRADGGSVPVECTTTPYDTDARGGAPSAVIVFRDVTERHAVERMKREFVSTVSHELRTPLTSINGALGLVRSGAVESTSPQGARMLDIAARNVERLTRLVNDVLDVERMEAGGQLLRRTACSAADVVVAACESVERLAGERSAVVTRTCADALVVDADADRLLQVVANLVGNAIHHSPAGVQVAVTTTAVQHEGARMVRFVVRDDGPGIHADDFQVVFERFARLDSSDSRTSGGSGLGLAICKRIVEAHGGRIWLESEPGAGAAFCFEVPRVGGSGDDAPPRTAGEASPAAAIQAAARGLVAV